jgi:hypothetical protein
METMQIESDVNVATEVAIKVLYNGRSNKRIGGNKDQETV